MSMRMCPINPFLYIFGIQPVTSAAAGICAFGQLGQGPRESRERSDRFYFFYIFDFLPISDKRTP